MSNRGQDWIKTTPEAYANFVDTVDQAGMGPCQAADQILSKLGSISMISDS